MIVVCGEALVDLILGVPQGSEIAARAVAGGSPFNVAVGLARLGAPTAFLGGISRDRFGELLIGVMRHEGVDERFLVRKDHVSTISVVATQADGQPLYSFHGEGAADRMLTLADLPAELPDDVAALTFGSYTLAVEPVASAYAALARREAGRRVISIDPNLRPAVVGDMARWEAVAGAFFRTATIVKASNEDIDSAWGGRWSIADAASFFLEQGAKLVVITEGAKGATAFSGAGVVSVPGRSVSVKDTVGAGDTFHAALLARLQAKRQLTVEAIAGLGREAIGDLLDYCTMAAAITCGRTGADLPTAHEVDTAFLAGGLLAQPADLPQQRTG